MQIDKMASIYKGAVTSLVLDAELMDTWLTTELTIDPSPQPLATGTSLQFLDTSLANASSSPDTERRLGLESRAQLACSV